MIRAARNLLIAATLALPLGGCGSVGSDINFDPMDWISGEWFNTKKPLPGDRKALFPEVAYFSLYAPMVLILAMKPTGLLGRE